MNNFIEINATNTIYRNVLVNLSNVTTIVRYTPDQKEEYWVNLVADESYKIDKEQYEAIRTKLIGKGEN